MRLCALLPGYSLNNKKHPWRHIMRNALAFQIMSFSDFFNLRTPAVIFLHYGKVSGNDANTWLHNWCNIWFKVVVQKSKIRFFLFVFVFSSFWRFSSDARILNSFPNNTNPALGTFLKNDPSGICACVPLLVTVISRFVRGGSHHITWIRLTYDWQTRNHPFLRWR